MSTTQDFISYLNLARQRPDFFASLIDVLIDKFVDNMYFPVYQQYGQSRYQQTHEGMQAWIEAKTFLLNQQPLNPLQEHSGLSLAAEDHAHDITYNGAVGHAGTDKSTLTQRVARYCQSIKTSLAQIVASDFIHPQRNTAETIILNLIIDDGDIHRSHRKVIFDPNFKFIGCKSVVSKGKSVAVFTLSSDCLTLKQQYDSEQSPFGLQQSNFIETQPRLKTKTISTACQQSRYSCNTQKLNKTGTKTAASYEINQDEISSQVSSKHSNKRQFGKIIENQYSLNSSSCYQEELQESLQDDQWIPQSEIKEKKFCPSSLFIPRHIFPVQNNSSKQNKNESICQSKVVQKFQNVTMRREGNWQTVVDKIIKYVYEDGTTKQERQVSFLRD